MSSVATHTNRSKPLFPGVSRKVLPVHRWLGITLGLLFALWFASGIILSFVPFPSLATRDRISLREAIDLQQVSVSPSAALAASGTAPVVHLRLVSVVGHPRYVAEAAGRFPVLQLRKLRNPREIEVTAVGGDPFLVVRDSGVLSSQLMSADDAGTLHTSLVIPDKLLLSAVRAAWLPVGTLGIQAIAADDAYRVRSNPLPDTARRIVLNDPTHTWIQIDAASGQILCVTDRSRRLYRWLVDGLHCFDFPLFKRAGPLRHVLILLAATTGLLFSCTGVVIGVERLRRSLI